jgi:4-amino-4-deoxy-L-arabinose transferase-like glycosyltransferase
VRSATGLKASPAIEIREGARLASAQAPPRAARAPRRAVVAGVVAAFAIRLIVSAVDFREPEGGLDAGYIETAAAMASGFGPLMPTSLAAKDDVIRFMKEREAAGGRVDREHPYPQDPHLWLPATGHPPGYSLLLFLLYHATNYTWMLRLIHIIQAAADALACLLVYVLVRNLFGSRPAVAALWIYALLPAPIVLTLRLQPDAFSCFFAAAILASATLAPAGRLRYGLLAGAAAGIASQFRAEFILWSAIVICAVMVAQISAFSKLRFAAAVLIGQFTVLMPWMYWTQRVTGHRLLTGSQGGSSIYEALGEEPQNPWGITLQDEWVAADALQRGFSSPWSPEADAYYRAKFWNSIRQHPASFLKLAALHRLPIALVPPFSSGKYNPGFNLWELRRKEGLTRWGAVLKYPGLVFKNMWFLALMGLLSLALMLGLLMAAVVYRSEWRKMAWLVVPWLLTISALSFAKEIEPRNVSPIVVPEAACMALLATRMRRRSEDLCPVRN